MSFLVLLFGGMISNFGTSAFADSGPYFPFGQPTGAGLIAKTQTDANGNPQLYGGSTGQPDNWSVSQWNTTNDFPALSYDQSTNQWSTGNGMSAFHWYPSATSEASIVAIAQNGQFLPCANGEFDMLFGPNGWAAANNPTQYPAQVTTNSPAISLMTHLYMSGTYTLNGARSGGSSQYACDVNQGNTAISVVLLNLSTSPYQFFFYNLHLSEFCVQSGTPNDQYYSCQQRISNQQPNWFWTGTAAPSAHTDGTHPQWGVDDHLNQYGGSTIMDNNSHGLAIDLLPRLTQLIVNNPYGMDPVPSHWAVTSTSFGQADWGNVYLASTFQGFVVLYSCLDNTAGCTAGCPN